MIALLVAIARDRARQVYIGQVNAIRQKGACILRRDLRHPYQYGRIESCLATMFSPTKQSYKFMILRNYS